MTALAETLPRTLPVLERRLNDALTDPLPRRMRRRSWELAIDWHLQPYYGQPDQSPNELYYGKPRHGTKKFHAYASACIVEYGHRYTVALTWVRRHESMVVVLQRLLARTRQIGLKIKRVLLDRAFFNVPVVAFRSTHPGRGSSRVPPYVERGPPWKSTSVWRPSLRVPGIGSRTLAQRPA